MSVCCELHIQEQSRNKLMLVQVPPRASIHAIRATNSVDMSQSASFLVGSKLSSNIEDLRLWQHVGLTTNETAMTPATGQVMRSCIINIIIIVIIHGGL